MLRTSLSEQASKAGLAPTQVTAGKDCDPHCCCHHESAGRQQSSPKTSSTLAAHRASVIVIVYLDAAVICSAEVVDVPLLVTPSASVKHAWLSGMTFSSME